MLRCTIELIPHGDESRKETLSVIKIINTGSGTQELGNYVVKIDNKSSGVSGGTVENFPRLQHGPEFLLARAIDNVLNGA